MINTSTNVMYQLELLNKQNITVNNQLSTGKQIQNGSEDAKLYGEIISIENELNIYKGVEEQLNKTSNYNNTSDSTVASLKLAMDEITSIVLTALNDTVDDETKSSMSKDAQNIKASIFNMLNEDVGGVYIFAGSNSSKEPFVMDENENITYTGSLDKKTSLVDENIYVEQGLTGIDIMFYTSSKANENETLTFSSNDVIIDNDNNEWSFIDHTGDGIIDDDILYLNANISNPTLSVTTVNPGQYELANTQNNTLESKSSYFDTLDGIINALDNKDLQGNEISTSEAKEILSKSLEEMEQAFTSINSSHAELGASNKSFENYQEINSAKILNTTLFHDEYSNADLTSAAVEAQSLEIIYSALYSTISRINSLSLVNYL